MLANLLLCLGQHLKFRRLRYTKLYVLEPFGWTGEECECAICLLPCAKGERVVQLPCFSEHVYHHGCMQQWFCERKECPLCRFSLESYQLL
jgi:hypothetical protein